MSRRRERPVGLGGPGPIEDPRPKPPKPLRTAVIAVVVVVAVVVWARYDPLEPGEPTRCPEGAEETPSAQFDEADAAEFGDRVGVCLVRNVDVTEATVTAVVRNEGPVAVRLTGSSVAGAANVFTIEDVAVGPPEAPLDPDRVTPIDGSVPLEGDSAQVVSVNVSIPGCDEVDQGRVATLPQLQLRGRVLGLPRDLELPLDPVLRVQTESCPPDEASEASGAIRR